MPKISYWFDANCTLAKVVASDHAQFKEKTVIMVKVISNCLVSSGSLTCLIVLFTLQWMRLLPVDCFVGLCNDLP